MCSSVLFILFSQIVITLTYNTNPTPWFCTDPSALDSTIEINRKLPSCLSGHVIHIEDVVYESTNDGTCSGKSLCSYHNKNALSFACNYKQKCDVDIRHSRFSINKTCGSTVRFFTKYRCLPVIQEQKNYSCESLTRRANSGDINLSCEPSYRLYINMALVGISVKTQDDSGKTRFKCNKNTRWICNQYIQDAYRSICSNQLNYGVGNQCKIRYSDRPALTECEHGQLSNFSLVEYSCIPGERIIEDLPRIDICSGKIGEQILMNRGLLHSPNYPQSVGQYLSCMKQLHINRESRLRLFMLEKSIEYYNELNIRLLNTEPNIQRTLAKNELFDTKIPNQINEEIVEIELKTHQQGAGNFLLYFQVDSRISEYAPTVLENDRFTDNSNRREKILIKRDWGVVIGGLIGLISVAIIIGIVILICLILKRRRARSLRYLKDSDEHRQHLNQPISSSNRHHPTKGITIEHPHFSSEPPKILSSSTNDHGSDCETLLKHSSHANPTRYNHESRPYEENSSPRQNRDYRENDSRFRRPAPLATPEQYQRNLPQPVCEAPMASTETLDTGNNSARSQRAQRLVEPPPRMDLHHPKPSAPPLHLLETNPNENVYPNQQFRQLENWNNNRNNKNHYV